MILKINDRIRTRKVDKFDKFNVNLRYDSVASTFAFNGYFDPDYIEHKELYCVSHYHMATLEHNGELLLTGTILAENFNSSSIRQPVSVAGYSLPGVLEDCQIQPSPSDYLQFNGLTLKQIATKLAAPFGLTVQVDPSVAGKMNDVFDVTKATPSESIKNFLSELASQKNIIISHNEKGNLLFTRAKTNKTPILNYGGDGIPCPEMSLSFDGQAMHSHITVIKQQSTKSNGNSNAGQSQVKNPYVPYVFRPRVILQNSGDDIDTELAAKNALSAELKNIKLVFTTDRWEIDGKIIKPNNLITVINPEVYLYKRTTWFIDQIEFKGDNKSTTATLTCVLPEVYSGETPKYIFAGINLH
jgi:prophage tail gpP-like protein